MKGTLLSAGYLLNELLSDEEEGDLEWSYWLPVTPKLSIAGSRSALTCRQTGIAVD